jgi:hypothetical protein
MPAMARSSRAQATSTKTTSISARGLTAVTSETRLRSQRDLRTCASSVERRHQAALGHRQDVAGGEELGQRCPRSSALPLRRLRPARL